MRTETKFSRLKPAQIQLSNRLKVTKPTQLIILTHEQTLL